MVGNAPGKRELIRALTGRGNALCATAERCPEAIPDFASVVKLAPNVAGFADNYARALRAARRFDEAIRASDQAIGLAPRMTFVYVGKAKTLAAAGRGDDALGVIDTAETVAPGDAGLWEYRGKLLGELGRFKEANAAFAHALALQPQRASVLVRRADVEIAAGEIDAAIDDLKRYPSNGHDADQVRGKLDALRAVGKRLANSSNRPADDGDRPASAVAASPSTVSRQDVDSTSSGSGPSCNPSSWTPIDECVREYHNDNDPLPSGAPNPRRWNDAQATEARSHLPTEAKRGDTIQAEADPPHASTTAGQSGNTVPAPPAVNASSADRGAESSIDTCNAPEVLSVIRKLSEDGAKKQAFQFLMANITDVKFELTGIRQLDYDAANEHRVCAMDRKMVVTYYAGTHLPPGRLSVPIKYEIDRQLDGDRGSYVTCKCD